jgi:hypothetical protein
MQPIAAAFLVVRAKAVHRRNTGSPSIDSSNVAGARQGNPWLRVFAQITFYEMILRDVKPKQI